MVDLLKQLEAGRLIIDVAMIGKLPDTLVNLLTDFRALLGTCESEVASLKKRISILENDLSDADDDYQDAMDKVGDLTKRLAEMAIERDKRSSDAQNSLRYIAYRTKQMTDYPQIFTTPVDFDIAFDADYGTI